MAYETGIASSHTDLYSKLKTFLQAGSNAAQTLTFASNAANTETVTIGAKTYTFQTTLTDVDGNVFIGATSSDTLNNLKKAINLDSTGAGTAYAAATVVHPTARSVRGAGNTLVVRAKTAGTGGNSLATTETLANGSFGAATMAGGGANPWAVLNDTGTSILYEAPGLSGTEEIHFGFSYAADVGTDAYAITCWQFRSYNPLVSHTSQPGHSGVGYHAVWNQPMDYKFVANGQRVVIITRVSTVETASYMGKFLQYGTPGEYPQPYYMSTTADANTRWSTTTPIYRNFFDPGNHAGTVMLNPNGSWFQVSNFRELTGENVDDGKNYIYPYADQRGGGNQHTRWREMRDNIDDTTYTLWPLILLGENPASETYGELDGCYACPGFDAASGDLIEQDNEFHVMVQNVFRTARYYYAAVKLA